MQASEKELTAIIDRLTAIMELTRDREYNEVILNTSTLRQLFKNELYRMKYKK